MGKNPENSPRFPHEYPSPRPFLKTFIVAIKANPKNEVTRKP